MSPITYISRSLEPKIRSLFQSFSVVVMSGARQVGKSTLLTHCFPNLPRVVFDPVLDVEGARSDPDLFLANRRPPLILDEIQYAPQLVSAIKRRLEQDRSKGQYLITGSQQWEVMKQLSESLAGRAVFLDLYGFSYQELAGQAFHKNPLESYLTDQVQLQDFQVSGEAPLLYEKLWRGGLPEAQFLSLADLPIFFEAYLRTYVERDLRLSGDISDWDSFGRFFRLAAALSAQEINYSQIGRELGISPHTAKFWLSLLKAGFQWRESPAYSGNLIKRLSHKPKSYLMDTGLLCSAQAISSPEAIGAHPLKGALFETFVFLELVKQAQQMNVKPQFYHWRSYSGAEVDVVLERDGKLYPIEIKCKSRPTLQDARGLTSFKELYPQQYAGRSLIISAGTEIYALKPDVWVLPWWVQSKNSPINSAKASGFS